MKYYLIDHESCEHTLILDKVEKKDARIIKTVFSHDGMEKVLFYRKLGKSLYFSKDQKKWTLVASQEIQKSILDRTQTYHLYRGFKPSGLNQGEAGELLTQMPGKVVKINVDVGQVVKKGDAVLILEAMKMEHQIKASFDARVKILSVSKDQQVPPDELLIELEAIEVDKLK